MSSMTMSTSELRMTLMSSVQTVVEGTDLAAGEARLRVEAIALGGGLGGERAAAGRGRDLTEAGGNHERACDQRGSCHDAVNLEHFPLPKAPCPTHWRPSTQLDVRWGQMVQLKIHHFVIGV